MGAPPPYGEISRLLKRGDVVPFLGAGVNFGMRQPPDAKWKESGCNFLPSGRELSLFLADNSGFPSEEEHDLADLAKVASFYVDTMGRERVRERLHELFDRDFEPCDIHNYLASLPVPILIVTTNYDDLTERAFKKAGKPYDLVVHPTDRKDVGASVVWWKAGAEQPEAIAPNRLNIDLKTTNVIYKMHGTVDRQSGAWDSYVITEEDYIDFLTRMTGQTAVPAQFMQYFRKRSFLFMGYGLNDWNLRVVLNNLKSVLPAEEEGAPAPQADEDLPSWAIQFRPSDLEKELWSTRHVKIYDVDINEFVRRLREKGEQQ
jgi:hypothetical protein